MLGFALTPATWILLGIIDITLLNACYVVWTVSYLAWALLRTWPPRWPTAGHTNVDATIAYVISLLVSSAPNHIAIR